jgi:hypothetical protein
VQVLSLGLSIVAMVVFLALLMALKYLNKSYAAIGAVIALTSQVLILVWLIAVGWKLSRLGTQRGSLLSPSNSVQL